MHIESGRAKNVLVVASEIASRALPWDDDPQTAALFGEHSDDRTTLATIAGIEELTNNLSGKIWTKISLLPSAVRRTGSAGTESR